MRGVIYLTGKARFELVYTKGRSWTTREMVIKVLPNGLDFSRYGLTVSRRIGKAVVRNTVKRRLREILRATPVQPGWDIIFIARAPASSAAFSSLGTSVRNLLTRAGLLLGEYEGISPGAH